MPAFGVFSIKQRKKNHVVVDYIVFITSELIYSVYITCISSIIFVCSVDVKLFLQLHDKLPVCLLHFVTEVLFERVNGVTIDLRNKLVSVIKVSAVLNMGIT